MFCENLFISRLHTITAKENDCHSENFLAKPVKIIDVFKYFSVVPRSKQNLLQT